jgi:Rrf2 family iron-sulfur cluster assembly transcriptional regulator
MHLSKTADHALRAVLYLAQHEDEGPMPAERIAEALGAPGNYLSKTLHQLARAGVVRGYRGPRGGFRLSVPAAELPLARVIEAFDDHSKREVCLMGDRPCDERDPCGVHQCWTDIVRNARAPLQRNSVADLLRGRCSVPSSHRTAEAAD